MFTNDQTNCDHVSIMIEIQQDEIQEYDMDLEKLLLTKVHDDINSSEPIKIVCNECHLNLKYEEITIENFVIYPLLDKENIDIIDYVLENASDVDNDEECKHDQIALELYQIIQYNLIKENGIYRIKETNFKDKEIYLICQFCSRILYENLENELKPLNELESDDNSIDEDIFFFNEESDDDENFDKEEGDKHNRD